MSGKKNSAENSAPGNVMSEMDVKMLIEQNNELAKRLEELEQRQNRPQLSFDEHLKLIAYQQQVVEHLQKFQSKLDAIKSASDQVKEKTENGDFDTKLYRLSLVSINGQQKSIFDISNPVVISKVLDGVAVEISAKIEALKMELSA